MAVNTGPVRRVSIVANPRSLGLARYEEKYRELSRLQRCPIIRSSSNNFKLYCKPVNPFTKILSVLATTFRALSFAQE
jgi:hypothetical protein